MTKILNMGIRGIYFNMIKVTHYKPTVNIILNDRKTQSFPPLRP